MTNLSPARQADPPPSAPPERLLPTATRNVAIDAYRGFVMLAMVSAGLGLPTLKDNPRWAGLARQFMHVDWQGWVFWDLIQPSFMFIVGAAMPYAFSRRQELGHSWSQQFVRVVQRAMLLVFIGFVLDTYRFETPHLAFIRVLQQIAIGYVLAFLVLGCGIAVQLLAVVAVLAVHTGVFLAYARNQGVDPWTKGVNAGAALDAWLGLPINPWGTLTNNPSGYVTLNALSSTATILFGVVCGEVLARRDWRLARRLGLLVLAGCACLAIGVALERVVGVPMVKKIWTASFGLFAAGCTFLMMAAFTVLFESSSRARWAFPLVVVGMNSIAVYVLHELLGPQMQRLVTSLLGPGLAYFPQAAPVLVAVLLVLLQWYFCYWLYRRGIFFKV